MTFNEYKIVIREGTYSTFNIRNKDTGFITSQLYSISKDMFLWIFITSILYEDYSVSPDPHINEIEDILINKSRNFKSIYFQIVTFVDENDYSIDTPYYEGFCDSMYIEYYDHYLRDKNLDIILGT